ncbi:hypothetical protein B0A70_12040 [Chryseobacterium piscicola]|jgi:hypothetical protein|uniref:Uncharacterized protein n=2 Tax=Chryseobacterium piscicola TaxID=551459 RepID=A0A2S7KD79_9FLAO|nr:hypothetical protein B0A70_12040 [Chryseobacterium piscicola]
MYFPLENLTLNSFTLYVCNRKLFELKIKLYKINNMKKLVLFFSAVLLTTVISCRQDDDNFSNEDFENLKLINKASQKIQDSTNAAIPLEGDPIPPPKR